jgi:hypothetical protein
MMWPRPSLLLFRMFVLLRCLYTSQATNLLRHRMMSLVDLPSAARLAT